MAPSETSILSNFLLSPAPLPIVMSLQQFIDLFPKRLRSHPHIRVLYRELQQLREQDMNLVNENIDKEIHQGETQMSELRKSVMRTGVDGATKSEQHEMNLDLQLFGQASASSTSVEHHSVSSLLSAMETACANIEEEIAEVDKDATAIISELDFIVGDMSDLRYGKWPGPSGTKEEEAVAEAIKGLQNLENACYHKPSA